MIGAVKSYDSRKGAGQITPDDGGPDVYFHVSALERAGLLAPAPGDRLTFDVQTDRTLQRSFAVNLALP